MTQCNHGAMKFSSCRRRRVRVDFSGGSISSNGGALLLREVDRELWSKVVYGWVETCGASLLKSTWE